MCGLPWHLWVPLTHVYLVLSKLRAKLGLKPLEVNAVKKGEWGRGPAERGGRGRARAASLGEDGTGVSLPGAVRSSRWGSSEAGTKEEPVAAELINPMALRQREELREKLAAAKEKRLLNQKLG